MGTAALGHVIMLPYPMVIYPLPELHNKLYVINFHYTNKQDEILN